MEELILSNLKEDLCKYLDILPNLVISTKFLITLTIHDL